MSLAMLALILFCVFTETGCALCFKHSADGAPVAVLMRRPFIWLGIAFWAVEIVAWVTVLEQVPLSLAFPVMSLVYAATVAGGMLILKETVTLRHALGASLITVGVACIGVTGL